jgi:uncharacterized protein
MAFAVAWLSLESFRIEQQVDIIARILKQRIAEHWPALTERHAKFALRRFAGPSAYVSVMNPIRVVHLTDMHVGRVTPMHVQLAATTIVNQQNADLVVITGDFVCHSQVFLEDLEEVMRSIKVPVVGVLGNHDHWSGAAAVRRSLRRAGVLVLDNANTTITIRGSRLQLVGLDDAYTGHADRAQAIQGLDPHTPVLGLSHIAEEADALWDSGVPLVLSGHTHGGQITLARLHELALGRLAGHKYVHGLYGSRKERGAVYVGAGIGASMMPLRLGERGQREITVFELGVAAGAFDEHHAEQMALPGRKPSPALTRARRAAVEKKKQETRTSAQNRTQRFQPPAG